MSKPRVLLFFSRIRTAQGLDAEVLKELLDNCDVHTMQGSDHFKLPFGTPLEPIENKLKGFKESLYYFVYFRRFIRFLENFDHPWLNSRNLYKGVSGKVSKLISLLRFLRSLNFAGFFAEWLIQYYNPYNSKLNESFDLVIAFNGVKDPYYDDIARWAKGRGIPLLSVPVNWDNLSCKPIIVRPDYMAVWGQQMLYIARSYQNFEFNKLFQIGSSRFETNYRVEREESRGSSREKLGLPLDKTILLFAGAGEHFDELPLLKILNDAVDSGELPQNVHIVYKPHPVRFLVKGGKIISDTDGVQQDDLTNVTIWHSGKSIADAEDNPYLISACDAIVSPQSTMVLEGAYWGIPNLSVFYNDPKHSEHDWEVYGRHINLLPLFKSEWTIECRSKETFLECAKKLIPMIGNQEISDAAKRDFFHCVYKDEITYGKRLLICAESILKRDLDGEVIPDYENRIYIGG